MLFPSHWLSNPLAIGFTGSVIGHVGVLLAATWIAPVHHKEARPAIEIRIVAAQPLPMREATALGNADAVVTRNAVTPAEPRAVRRRKSIAITDETATKAEPSAVTLAVAEPETTEPSEGNAASGDDTNVPSPPVVTASGLGAPSGAAGAALITAKPRYRSNPLPEYPVISRRRHETGIVLLDVDVDAEGRPSRVALHKTSGFTLLDDTAVAAVRGWLFEPAQRDGVRIASTAVVPVRFSLEN